MMFSFPYIFLFTGRFIPVFTLQKYQNFPYHATNMQQNIVKTVV
jgi:hypothetical protein